ncbi:MAG: hypothetical protein DELT_02913 [Desulfovibrio sp.]
MTIIRTTCIFLLVTVCLVAGCSKQPPSLLSDPNPYDAPLPPFSTPVTCEEVRLAYYRYPAPSIVKKLMENNETNWRMIMGKIVEGDAEWISCATRCIRPGTDAGATGELKDALAYALQHNPAAVLSQEQGFGISMSEICSWPFIEPEYDFVLSYGEKALAALHAVDIPYLQESRDICIQRLQSGFDFLKKEYREGRWGY